MGMVGTLDVDVGVAAAGVRATAAILVLAFVCLLACGIDRRTQSMRDQRGGGGSRYCG